MEFYVGAIASALVAALYLATAVNQQEPRDDNGRYIVVVRHGTKIELGQRFDLPIYPFAQCEKRALIDEIVPFLQSLGQKTSIVCSPFVRTKQTALRIARALGIPGVDIRCRAGIGESFRSVHSQLKRCADGTAYRIPVHRELDPCMAQMDATDLDTYVAAVTEVNEAGVPLEVEDEHYCAMPPQTHAEHTQMVDATLKDIVEKTPMDTNIVIATHSKNVRRALASFVGTGQEIMALRTKTCGAIVFFQSAVSGNMRIVAIAT